MGSIARPPSQHQREFLFAVDRGQGLRMAKPGAGGLASGIGLAIGPTRLPFGGDQCLEPAGLGFDQRKEPAHPDLLPLGVAQGGGEFGQPRFVVIDPEHQLDDRGHRRPGLRLHARFLEQLGISVRILLACQREVVSVAERSIEGASAASVGGLCRLGILARCPQQVA
jgi:hypothetical protein